ncbi:MAG: MFS transporter [Colwellia sp.]|nr:MFS transporter [Colwellia sp.]
MSTRTISSLLKQPHLPYWRLSSLYFFNCLILGLVLPFWGVYLNALGLSGSQIGISTALLLASNIIAPFFWQKLTTKFNRSIDVIKIGLVLALLCSLLLFHLDSFFETSLFIFVLSFCWQGINPLIESLTLSHLGSSSAHYGQIRLWGSIGFVVAVSGLGYAFEVISINALPFILVSFIFFMLFSSHLVPEQSQTKQETQPLSLMSALRKSTSTGMFIAAFLAQVGQGAYIGFFSLTMQQHSAGLDIIGYLWSVAVIAEVVMFVVVYRIISKFGADKLLALSFLITALRWIAVAFYAELIPLMFIAQLLHAFTYSATHSAIIELIRQQFGKHNQGKGIVIYSTLCLGGGTALGTILCGFLWQFGSMVIFSLSAILTVAASIIIWLWSNSRVS